MVIKSGRSPAHQNRSSLQDVKVLTSHFYGLLRSPFCALSTLWTYWPTFHSSDVPSSLCVRALALSQIDSRVTVSFRRSSQPEHHLLREAFPSHSANSLCPPFSHTISKFYFIFPKQVSLLDIKQGNNFRL